MVSHFQFCILESEDIYIDYSLLKFLPVKKFSNYILCIYICRHTWIYLYLGTLDGNLFNPLSICLMIRNQRVSKLSIEVWIFEGEVSGWKFLYPSLQHWDSFSCVDHFVAKLLQRMDILLPSCYKEWTFCWQVVTRNRHFVAKLLQRMAICCKAGSRALYFCWNICHILSF